MKGMKTTALLTGCCSSSVSSELCNRWSSFNSSRSQLGGIRKENALHCSVALAHSNSSSLTWYCREFSSQCCRNFRASLIKEVPSNCLCLSWGHKLGRNEVSSGSNEMKDEKWESLNFILSFNSCLQTFCNESSTFWSKLNKQQLSGIAHRVSYVVIGCKGTRKVIWISYYISWHRNLSSFESKPHIGNFFNY